MALAWQEIRAMRATPPGLAAEGGERRAVFDAALRQAQELAEAATVAGYAAKPLPAFYALSQAGRAIAAARLANGWKLKGHGLSPVGGSQDVLTATVKPNPPKPSSESSGSFQGVAAAVGSATLAGSCELGALWAANPDLDDVAIPGASPSWVSAVRVPLGTRRMPLTAPGIQPQSPQTTITTTGGWVTVSVNVEGNLISEVSERLAAYPTLRDARPYGLVTGGSGPAESHEAVVRFTDPVGVERVNIGRPIAAQVSLQEYYDRQNDFCSVIDETESWPPEEVGYALPALAGGPAPDPLLLWWSLLLGLSSFARYEPAAWTAAIDPSTSPLAVALERVLDIAQQQIPKRVLASLHG